METSKLTAEGIIGEAVRIGAKMSGGEFPIEVFPIRIQRIISSLHDCQGYPVDYVAAAILAAIAVGIGNSHLVQVKRNWLESPILYMALIGRPGANKSHPLSFAFQPFIEHDYCQNQEYQKLYAEYERTMSMSKKERSIQRLSAKAVQLPVFGNLSVDVGSNFLHIIFTFIAA